MIKEIIRLQDEVNTQTAGADWREKELLWTMALTQETAELIESINLSWWKNVSKDIKTNSYTAVLDSTTEDRDNIEVELIDILHFLISYKLVQYTDEELEDMFNKQKAMYVKRPRHIYKVPSDYKYEVFKNARAFVRDFDVANFFELVRAVDIPIEEVYALYLGKNTLNKFRQDNGYKDGTYRKMWDGEEDNVTMRKLVKQGYIGATLYQELYKRYRGI